MTNGGHWARQARIARRVSLSLGTILVLLCVLAMVAMVRLDTATAATKASHRLANLYQDARYYASVEARELDSYRLERSAASKREHDVAASALDTILTQIRGLGPVSKQSREVLLDQDWYRSSARLMFTLVDSGQLDAADRLDSGEIHLVSSRIEGALGALEEGSHLAAAASIDETATLAQRLATGTPFVIALGLVLLGLIVLANRAYRRTIERQALEDALTGLPNRTVFADRAVQALAQVGRSRTDPVVMVLDLDEFKEVNDTLGHLVGDRLLVDVASRLSAIVRAGDTLARMGGDEFAVLLTDGGPAAGTKLADRIMLALEQPFVLDSVTLSMEASIGIATARGLQMPASGEQPSRRVLSSWVNDLLRHADSAMYAAKSGRTGFALFRDDQEDPTPNRLAVLGELRHAFDHDELVLHFQPKLSVFDNEVVGVEALVRWQHPTRGLLPPAEFIGLAESTTLIHRLTAIVLEKALASVGSWRAAGRQIPVAVNISARSLLDAGFPDMVMDKLAAAGVPPGLLCLELTESAIMQDPDGSMRILRELHDRGVRLSIDDFGTGYSSMAHLKILPVDELKVDRSFVADMTTNDRNTVLVHSAIDLGHNLGLSVVAEGVEDHATLVALAGVGADVVQGFHTGRPMPLEALAAWLDALQPAEGSLVSQVRRDFVPG